MDKNDFVDFCADPEFLNFIPWEKIRYADLIDHAGRYDPDRDLILVDASVRDPISVLEIICHELAHRYTWTGVLDRDHDRFLAAISWGLLYRVIGEPVWRHLNFAGLRAHDLRDDRSDEAFEFALRAAQKIGSERHLCDALRRVESLAGHCKIQKNEKWQRNFLFTAAFCCAVAGWMIYNTFWR